MSKLETHVKKARQFRDAAERLAEPSSQVELWFVSAYHYIEACAAKHRLHIQKHQRVPEELERNPTIFGKDTSRIASAFQHLDREARAKFVYGDTGTDADFRRVREWYRTIESVCEALLR